MVEESGWGQTHHRPPFSIVQTPAPGQAICGTEMGCGGLTLWVMWVTRVIASREINVVGINVMLRTWGSYFSTVAKCDELS